MNTIQDWAEYYRQKRLWVFPYNIGDTSMAYWKYWRNIKEPQYVDLYEGYNWNNVDGIKVVVGKKGIRVLVLNSIENEKNKMECLYRALAVLKLPTDYPWIIEIEKRFAIIVDTPSDIIGMGNRTYAECLLLWEGSFVMPSSSNNRHFYKNRLPEERPIQIKNEFLFACIRDLRSRYSTNDAREITSQTSEEATAEATSRIKGLTYKYDDFYRNFIHIGSIVWFLVGGAFCFHFFSGFILALVVWILSALVIYYVAFLTVGALKGKEIERYLKEFPEDEMVRIISHNNV